MATSTSTSTITSRALQKWVRQPSISNSGEGIPESAEMVKGFFEQLGCQESRVYDVGITEWGAPGNPVVYARCDYGAPRTIAIYWQYDTMPITQPDAWTSPPFEGRLVEQPPFKKCHDRPRHVQFQGTRAGYWNALMSIKAVTGKLPVNIVFIAEGDEERMDIGLRKFVKIIRTSSRTSTRSSAKAAIRRPAAGRASARLGRLRLLRADDERQGVGPRSVQSDIHGATSARWTVRRGVT